jgi:hypothetical protein
MIFFMNFMSFMVHPPTACAGGPARLRSLP